MSNEWTIMDRVTRGMPLDCELVIDGHAHYGWSSAVHAPYSDAQGLLTSMDRIGIRLTCISSLQALEADYSRGNDQVADVVRRYPERFAGYAVINPNYPEDVDRELARCLDRLGLWAVKIHPGFHAYPPDGPVYKRVYACIEERGGVVLSHTFGTARILDDLSSTYPHVLFILAHWGGGYEGRLPDPYMPLLLERDNVYTDTVLSRATYGGLEGLVEQIGADKLIFGTDAPYMDNAHQIGRVTHARIPDEDKRKILGLNLQRIFQR